MLNKFQVNTPEKLLKYMDKISYGYKSKNGIIKTEDYDEFGNDYRLQSPEEVEKSKVGVCWDQVEYERYIFENVIKLPFKTYYIEQTNKMSSTHTFLVYHKNNKSYYFEHSYESYKGIYEFDTDEEVIRFVMSNMRKDQDDNGMKIHEYKQPEYGIGCLEFMNFCCQTTPINESYLYNKEGDKMNINEDTLSSKERNELEDKEFGIPELRKYPLVDKDHVMQAIRFFNKVDSKYEKELAKNIIKKMRELKMKKIFVGDGNPFFKYYLKSGLREDALLYKGIVLLEAGKIDRTFKCPYCNERFTRVKLVDHIEDKHEDMIPQNYTAARVVFNMINHKEHGTCVQCRKETPWNDDTWRYERYCSEKCLREYVATAKARMIKTYGKAYLLDEPDHQEKMLKGRGISGEYKFRDGGVRSYCGSYEKILLEFFDSEAFNARSTDVETPGPVIEYEFEGKKHFWITDVYYSPANLVFDVKDGGDNPNTREMPEYRAKQEAKEAAILKQGKYNYIRLTNNNFAQLLYILAEIRERLMDGDDKTQVIHINEFMSTGAMNPPIGMDNTSYVVPCMINNTFIDLAYSKDKSYKDMYIANNGKLKKTTRDELKETYNLGCLYEWTGEDYEDRITKINKIVKDFNDQIEVTPDYFYNIFTGKDLLSSDQFFFDDLFKEVKDDFEVGKIRQDIVKESFTHQYNKAVGSNVYFPIIDPELKPIKESLLKGYPHLDILQDINGYFVYDTIKDNRTLSYNELYSIDTNLVGTLEGI